MLFIISKPFLFVLFRFRVENGIFGILSSPENPGMLVAALVCLALFMGAASNYTVSLAAQYWRREDFSTVFAAVNPVANLINSLGPMLVAIVMIASMDPHAPRV